MADKSNDDWLIGLARLLQEGPSAAPRGGLFGVTGSPSAQSPTFSLSDLLTPPPPPQGSALSGFLAPYVPPFGSGPSSAAALPPLPLSPPPRRRVFFSFHYEDDIRRACIVRQSWRFRPAAGSLTPASFIDNSLWEKSRRQSEESLKRLIREGMAQSTATCVLAGTNTWARPWVRFEIAHSLFRKNGLFVAAIHNVSDPRSGPSAPGANPLDHIGLVTRSDGRGEVWETCGSRWQRFELAKWPVPWPAWLPKPDSGFVRPLSHGAHYYDYALQDGHRNLPHWAHEAARAAKRQGPLRPQHPRNRFSGSAC